MPNRLVHRRSSNRVRPDLFPDPRAAYAVLEQQVVGLEKDVTDLGSSIVGLDRKMTEALSSLGGRMETAIASINAKLDEKSRTHWPTLIAAGSLLVVIMGSLGSLAYLPIKATQDTQAEEIKALRMVELRRAEELGWIRAKHDQDMPR
jgi:hypothetical protein